MNNGQSGSDALGPLLSHIKIVAMMHSKPAAFIRQLQAELETFTGANVSFCNRNIDWLNRFSFLEERQTLSPAEQQSAICQVASMLRQRGDIDEQLDYISSAMFDHLDAHNPCRTTV